MAGLVGEDQHLRRARDHVDADLAEHQPLGRRHIGVAGPDDLGDRRDGRRAIGERRHRLRAADAIDLVDAGELRGRQHQRLELAVRRRHHHDEPRHARDLGRHGVHQHRGRIGGGAARHIEPDRLDRGPAVAELDAERVGEAVVRGQLPAVIGLDAVARERERIERPAVAGGIGRLDLGGGDLEARPGRDRRGRTCGSVRRSAASPRAATSAMMARTAASTSAAASRLVARKARKRSAKSAARLSRRIGMACPAGPDKRPVNALNGAQRDGPSTPRRRSRRRHGPGGTPSARTGPRSASSASRHSTSSRSAPPPEKIKVTTPAGASVSSNSTARRLSTASLPAGSTLRHLQPLTRSKRSAERQRRSSGWSRSAAEPVEPARAHDEALLLRTPDDVGDLDDGILQMGGDDLEVVPVEGNELHRLHGARSLPPFHTFRWYGVVRDGPGAAQAGTGRIKGPVARAKFRP